MIKRSTTTPGTARLRRVILCLLSIAFAGYLLTWFMVALDSEHLEAVAEWGRQRGLVWEIRRPGGRAVVAPGRVVHPDDRVWGVSP